MKISLNWLKDFVNIPDNIDPEELAKLITVKTAEVEGVENEAKKFENMVVGKVLKIEKHPNADRLSLAKVDIGR